jgi:hypothetical protein
MIKLLAFFFLLLPVASFGQDFVDTVVKEPKLGSVLRTVRPYDIFGDTAKEVLQVETSKAKRVDDIVVKFGVYSGRKLIYSDKWKAKDYFDPKDKLADSVKWRRLRRIMTYFFSSQNFTSSSDSTIVESLGLLERVDIKANSAEEKEFLAAPHRIFSVYAGRDKLYGITYLGSKNKFVTVWRN